VRRRAGAQAPRTARTAAARAATRAAAMNPGIGEEAGSTARTVVEALRSTPAILALVLFNISFMAVGPFIHYSNHSAREGPVHGGGCVHPVQQRLALDGADDGNACTMRSEMIE